MALSTLSKCILACALLLTAVLHVSAHATLRVPASRNQLDGAEYNKAGNNGRGATGGAICGDGGQSRPQFGKRGTIPAQNRFVAGQTIDVDVWMQHSHKGRMEFRICQYQGDETPATLNQACLDKHILRPAPGQSRVYNGHFWLGAYTYEAGTVDLKIKYILPNDLNCDGATTHCVLQMTYMNGNSCNPPGDCPVTSPSNCFPPTWVPVCNVAVHERFRNCADIIVTGGGNQQKPALPPPKAPTTQTSTPLPNQNPRPASPAGRVSPSGSPCCRGKPDGFQKNGPNCNRVCLCQGGRAIRKLRCRDGYSFERTTRKCRLTKFVRC